MAISATDVTTDKRCHGQNAEADDQYAVQTLAAFIALDAFLDFSE